MNVIVTAVGSYPKIGQPAQAPSLRTAINKFDTGKITKAELNDISAETTKDIIQQQTDAGLDMITDGQINWSDGQTYFAGSINGFSINGLIRYFDTNTYYRHPIAETSITRRGTIAVDDYKFAARHSTKPVKAIITGPYTLARLSQCGSYINLRSLALTLATILNKEAHALQQAGAPLIQFDEPAIVKWKEDIQILQETSEIVTQGITTKTAIYTWFNDISGIELDFLGLPFQVFGLDFIWGPENWKILDQFPSDKELGLGIVDGRNTRMEPVEEVVESIRRASHYVSSDRLHVNPSCGLDYLPRDKALKKLVRLVNGVETAKGVLK